MRTADYDYCKLAFEGNPASPRYAEDLEEWRKNIDTVNRMQGTVTPVRQETLYVGGNRAMHIAETWGEQSRSLVWSLAFLSPAVAQQTRLLRVDLRQKFISEDAFERAMRAATEVKGRNLQTFNTRLRTKAGDRDAGGQGAAIGSHKSDRRVSLYRRGKEFPAYEVQLRMRAVAKAVDALTRGLRMQYTAPAEAKDPVQLLTELDHALQAEADAFSRKVMGGSMLEVVAGIVAAPEPLPPATPATMRDVLKTLSRAEKEALVAELESQLRFDLDG